MPVGITTDVCATFAGSLIGCFLRDRNINAARAERLNEIMETRKDFMSRQGEIADLKKNYQEMKFPAV